MEAFLLGKKWNMLGSNFLSNYKENNPKSSPIDFIAEIIKLSGKFVLYAPPRENNMKKKALFAQQNIKNMANYFRFYLQNI